MATDFTNSAIPENRPATESWETLHAQLLELRARFQALVSATGGQIWITDPAGSEMLWSSQPDYADGVTTKSVFDRVVKLHVDDQAKVWSAIHRSLELQQPLEVEARSDGKGHPAEHLWIRGVPVTDAQGELVEWLGIVWDVDRWRLAERDKARELSLRTQSEQLLRRNNELLHVLAMLAQKLIGTIEAKTLLAEMWLTLASAVSAEAYLWIDFRQTPDETGWAIVDRAGRQQSTLMEHLRQDPELKRLFFSDPSQLSGNPPVAPNLTLVIDHLQRCLAEQGFQTCSFQPIESSEAKLGLLVFLAREPQLFNSTEQAFFATVGNYLSLALQRMQARRIALEQNQKLRLALSSSRMAVFELYLADFRLELSEEIVQLLGIRQSLLSWSQWQSLVDLADRVALQEKVDNAVSSQAGFEIEIRLNGVDGNLIWVSMICEPIFDDRKNLSGFLGTVQDISARKQIEQDLQTKAQHLREAQRIAGLSSYRWDAQQDRFLWSDSVDQVHGCGWGKQTRNLADFLGTIHPDDQERVQTLLQSALVSRNNFAFEYRSRNPEVQEFQWFAARGQMVVDEAGEVTAVEGTCQDVTERRLHEEVSRERDERRRLAVESVGSVGWMLDPETRQIEVFVSAQEWSAWLPKTRFDLSEALEFLHPDDRETLLQNVRIPVESVHPVKFQFRIIKQDQVRWVSCSAKYVRAAADNSPKLFGICLDITEQVLLQEKLATQNQQLLHASRLSTLGTLTAVMSHELSQPFTAIANFASAAKSIADSTRSEDRQLLHEYLEKISLQSVRAGSIIRNLRSFSRKSERHTQSTDLSAIMADSIGLLQMEIRSRRVRMHWKPPSTTIWLAIDPVQLQQVFINLLSNALDAVAQNPIGKRAILLQTILDSDRKGVRIEVIDNGPGVPAHLLPNLFQPFTCGKLQGTGIGLSICRDIVNNHQGKIEYQANPSGGAIFSLWFPVEACA